MFLRRHLISLFLLGSLLAACQTSAPPAPSYVSRNADWQPQMRMVNGFEMVKVPAGCFTMGSRHGRRDERPLATICIDQAFWLDRFEVTNAQYGSEGAHPGPNRPRDNISWFEARDFCAKRGGRLPSEAEWEFAARGPDGLAYPWGNVLVQNLLVFDKNNNNQTADVGSKPAGASWVGAVDMAGNVWEWTNTLYAPYPYRADDGRESPDALGARVFRGGWLSYIDDGPSAHTRFRTTPDKLDWFIGVRCALPESAAP
jgi:formylglycine-generating enzyme required for sulfatase activity